MTIALGAAADAIARLDRLGKPGTRVRQRLAEIEATVARAEADSSTLAGHEWLCEADIPAVAGLDELRTDVDQPPALVRTFEALRNVLVLGPITWTWLGLETAAHFYQACHELGSAKTPGALGRVPFLLLWQQGFVTPAQESVNMSCDIVPLHQQLEGASIPGVSFVGDQLSTFAGVIGIDFDLLVIILTLTCFVHWWILRYRSPHDQHRCLILADALSFAATLQARARRLRPMHDLSQVTRDAADTLRQATQQIQTNVDTTDDAAQRVRQAASTLEAKAAIESSTHGIASRTKSAVESSRRLEADVNRVVATTEYFDERLKTVATNARAASESAHASANSAGGAAMSAAAEANDAHASAIAAADSAKDAAETAAKLATGQKVLSDVAQALRRLSLFSQRRHVALVSEVGKNASLVIDGIRSETANVAELVARLRPTQVPAETSTPRGVGPRDIATVVTALGIVAGLLVRAR